MTRPVPYRIVAEADEHGQRIIAIATDSGVEIAGAYRPGQLNDWKIYVTKLVAEETGLPQPHKAHVCSREDAVRWIDTLASLYAQSVGRAAVAS